MSRFVKHMTLIAAAFAMAGASGASQNVPAQGATVPAVAAVEAIDCRSELAGIHIRMLKELSEAKGRAQARDIAAFNGFSAQKALYEGACASDPEAARHVGKANEELQKLQAK